MGGPERVAQMLARAGLFGPPAATGMIPETHAARLHRVLREEEETLAPVIAHEAGRRTGSYILAHRIPKPAQLLLRALPAPLAARALSQAIAKHAWTFAGSGRFQVVNPWTFEIADNPLVRGETSDLCLCDWHAGVFTRLYSTLVAADAVCSETKCCARRGDDRCRFEITRAP